jgi:hypothetical protein
MCIKINKVGKQEVGMRSDIWSQASYRYPISWEAFLDPSDSYFLFAEERGVSEVSISSQFILFLHNIKIKRVGSRNLTGPKTLPTIWHTYMKLVIKYQIPVINGCLEKCDEK